MNMKTMSVLTMLTVLVAGIAVNGSRAQPLPAASVAFQQCLEGEHPGNRCRSLGKTLTAMEEAGGHELGGANDVGGNVGGDVGGDVGGNVGGDIGGNIDGDAGGDFASAGSVDFLRDLAARALEVFLAGLARVFVQNLIRGNAMPISLDAKIDSTLFDPVR